MWPCQPRRTGHRCRQGPHVGIGRWSTGWSCRPRRCLPRGRVSCASPGGPRAGPRRALQCHVTKLSWRGVSPDGLDGEALGVLLGLAHSSPLAKGPSMPAPRVDAVGRGVAADASLGRYEHCHDDGEAVGAVGAVGAVRTVETVGAPSQGRLAGNPHVRGSRAREARRRAWRRSGSDWREPAGHQDAQVLRPARPARPARLGPAAGSGRRAPGGVSGVP